MGLAAPPGKVAGDEAEPLRERMDGGAGGGGERSEELAAGGFRADAPCGRAGGEWGEKRDMRRKKTGWGKRPIRYANARVQTQRRYHERQGVSTGRLGVETAPLRRARYSSQVGLQDAKNVNRSVSSSPCATALAICRIVSFTTCTLGSERHLREIAAALT